MTIHVNMTTDPPLMNSIAVKKCRCVDVVHSKGEYQEPIIVILPILDHRDGHYVRLNKVVFKYRNFKKNVDPDDHVRVFNYRVKTNVENSEKYIINAFSYMLKDTTLDWCHNYMSKFPDCIFSKFTQAFCKHHWKTQNDEQIYMEMKNMKQGGD